MALSCGSFGADRRPSVLSAGGYFFLNLKFAVSHNFVAPGSCVVCWLLDLSLAVKWVIYAIYAIFSYENL